MKPNIGIKEGDLKKIIEVLSTVLASEMMLYQKTRNYHWNVSGPSFMEIHQLFEKHYKLLEENIDEIAERISKLGGKTIGTMKEFIDHSLIKENPGTYPDQKGMMKQLLTDHETIAKELRNQIDLMDAGFGDVGTIDFLTKQIQEHETISWSLRRYLE